MIWGAVSVKKFNVTLKSYSSHSIPVIGEAAVHVKYGNQEIDLPIIVNEGNLHYNLILDLFSFPSLA